VAVGVRVVAVLAVLAVLVVAVVALVWAFQRQLIYYPGGAPPVAPAVVLEAGTAAAMRTDDGLTLTAWYAPATGPARGSTVLVLPGNAGSRMDRVSLARALSAEGFDVLLLDYRGYGGNPGSPTEAGLAADARAAYRYLVDERGVEPDRLVLFGESIGGAVAARLAREEAVGAVVLRSPFTSLADIGAMHYPFLPVRLLLRDRFPTAEHVAAVTAPVVVVVGDADEVVPAEQSRAVAAAAGSALVEVPAARHNDPELAYGPAVVDAVVAVSG
jgi:fermentation-respiration switch protein FrsA (DUF1100 family)